MFASQKGQARRCSTGKEAMYHPPRDVYLKITRDDRLTEGQRRPKSKVKANTTDPQEGTYCSSPWHCAPTPFCSYLSQKEKL